MSKLSNRMQQDVVSACYEKHGVRPWFISTDGRALDGDRFWDGIAVLRRKIRTSLQESINLGAPNLILLPGDMHACVVGLEDRRMVHGGLVMGPIIAMNAEDRGDANEGFAQVESFLLEQGVEPEKAQRTACSLPVWAGDVVQQAGSEMHALFYQVSGWKPELMEENRQRYMQDVQINRAIQDQRRHGKSALYAFEKERVLLANIRAGDRNTARRLLNEMLATIYMSSPRLVVLRARTIELISCLTRAAIEDNPLLEPLIERNHAWTERLIHAQDFEQLSHVLMDALDDFIDGIYLHGENRTNEKVRQALDFISDHFTEPISLADVADAVELSRCRLAHLVKEFTGRTINQLILQVRLNHAQHLLARTSKNCAEIAAEVGFSDQSYFTKLFKRETGTTPAKYRRFQGKT